MHTHGIFPRDPSRLSGIAKVRHLGQASLIYREQKRIYAFVDIAASCICLYFSVHCFSLGVLVRYSIDEYRYFQGVATCTISQRN